MGTYVDRDKVDLGVSVLASLRGGHLDNLAGAAFKPRYELFPPPLNYSSVSTHP